MKQQAYLFSDIPEGPSFDSYVWTMEVICRGDVNCDTEIDALDVSYIINRVYKGWDILCHDQLGDVDCSGNLDPTDATYLVNRVYKSWPFPDC